MTFLDRLKQCITAEKQDPGPPNYAEYITRRDFAGALPLLRAAIEKEDARAMGTYAALCALGEGVPENTEEAYAWFLQAANRGDLYSQVAVGICLLNGTGVARNELEAVYWLYRAGSRGSTRAIETLREATLRNCSLIGPHFSAKELNDLTYLLMKRKTNAPSSTTVH